MKNNTHSSRHRFVRNIRWQFVSNAIQGLLGGAYLIFLGRILGPADFGVFSAVMALVAVIGLLLEMRLQEVVARDFCHLDDIDINKHPTFFNLIDLFVLEIVSRVIPTLFLIITAIYFAEIIKIDDDAGFYVVLAAITFFLSKSGSSVSTGLLRVLGRTDIIAGFMTADWGMRLLITALIAIFSNLNLSDVFWVSLIVGLFCNILQVWLAFKIYLQHTQQISEVNKWKLSDALHRLRTGRRLIISNLGISATDLMAKDLDVILISNVLSIEKVGLYKMAKSFVQVMWRIVDPFYIAIMPEVQKLWQLGRTIELKILLKKTSIRLLMLAILITVFANLLMHFLGEYILGQGYIEVPSLMRVMSIWVVICAPLIWGLPLAVAINRPEISLCGSVLGLVVGLTAFSVLTPIDGLTGAAVAWNATLISGFLFTTLIAVIMANLKIDKLK